MMMSIRSGFLIFGLSFLSGAPSIASDAKMDWQMCHTLKHSYATCVAYSPDGNILVTGAASGYGVKLWNSETGVERGDVSHPEFVRGLSFSPDGKTLASVATPGKDKVNHPIQLWDVSKLQPLRPKITSVLTGRAIAFVPQTNVLATSVLGGVHLIDLDDLEKGPRAVDAGEVTCLGLSLDGKQLVTGGPKKVVRVWNLLGDSPKEMFELFGHTASVYSVAFAPSGKTIASGSEDGTVRLWDLSTGKQIHALRHGGKVLSISFSPDGKWLASGGDRLQGGVSKDGQVKFWEVASGMQLGVLEINEGVPVESVVFHPQGKHIALAAYNVQVWELKTKQK